VNTHTLVIIDTVLLVVILLVPFTGWGRRG